MKLGHKSATKHKGKAPASSRTKPPFRRTGGSGVQRNAASRVQKHFRMFLVPCSCGTTFAVSENYDRQGTAWSRYMVCPGCGKHHDPKNRLLQMGFQSEGYWKVDEC